MYNFLLFSIFLPDNQDNTNMAASQFTEDNEIYFNINPNLELHQSYEVFDFYKNICLSYIQYSMQTEKINGCFLMYLQAANNNQNNAIVPLENPPSNLKLEHFNLHASSQNENGNADDEISPVDDPLENLNFEDFDLPTNTPTQNDNPNVGRAIVEDMSNDFKFSDFDWAPSDNKEIGSASFADQVSNFMMYIP